MGEYIDLHLHTTYSDGVYTPAQVVEMAADRGLKAIAIADHDSVSGVSEAMAAGAGRGVEVIPAVELSVEYGGIRDIHLLGYFIDHTDAKLLERLSNFREARDSRGRAIIQRINEKLAASKKAPISYEEVRALAGDALGRPHIARILVKKGCARDNDDAFTRFLGPCDAPKQYFDMAEAIQEVKRVGGAAVLAHPPSISSDRRILKRLIAEFAELRLDGLEVLNNMCYNDDTLFFESLAGAMGLAMTGGSDFHGMEDAIEIGVGRGGLAVPYQWVEELRKRSVGGGIS